MDKPLQDILTGIADGNGRITVLTGAGISAESGIPTFRGPEGYWTVGSREYHPQEMATYEMFVQNPDEVWKWYLYRMGVCQRARPNAGHQAIAELERLFEDRFTLITQNVDGLHLRAGNSLERTYQIHGNVFFMRCFRECSDQFYPIAKGVLPKSKGEKLTDEDRRLLRCPQCGAASRPHILWFDETYNEVHYRYDSSLKAASETALLLIVGTSGATHLPNQVAWTAARQKAMIIDVNIEENPFSALAIQSNGRFIRSASGAALPEIAQVMKKALNR